MKVVIPGGSGQVGTILARDFQRRGDEVVVLSRKPAQPTGVRPWRVVAWDGRSLGDWQQEIDGAEVVINLAGRSVNCRYHQRNRREIVDSRILSTRVVGQAIAQAQRPPRLWLQASTATIYAHRYDAPNDECTGIIGGSEPGAPETWNFSIDVVTGWEREFDAAITPHTRKVAMRSAMTMSPDRHGIFDVLRTMVRLGLGGQMGDGRQFMSWTHEYDFIRAVHFLIEHEEMSGKVNIASPNPLPNAEFMRELRAAVGIPFGLPAPAWLLEIGAVVIRTETELILKSRRVVPGRLLAAGFEFEYPHWHDAARELCARPRTVWERASVPVLRERSSRP
jgi:hypothetical protein